MRWIRAITCLSPFFEGWCTSATKMGRFTVLSLDDAKRLAATFGVDVARVEALSSGSVNSNFRLTDTAGAAYFARIYEEQAEDGALAELRLLRELARAGIPTTVPLSPQGSSQSGMPALGGKPFAMYPWVHGEILCQARVTPKHCQAVGETLARLHLATAHVTPLAGGRFRIQDLVDRLERIERESPEHRDAALHIRHRLRHHAARRDPSLPTGLIHGDLFRDNVLWSGQDIAAVIDFESAATGSFAFDVMVTLLAWCFGDAFGAELISALLLGYETIRPLEAREWDALLTEGAIASLRFATTRITDFSMRASPGTAPLRDYRRFLERLEALEGGVLDLHRAEA